MRRFKNKWKIVLEDSLYYLEHNKGTTDDNPIWVRESVNGFSTKEGADDYLSKTVILEKQLYVDNRDN